MKGLNQYTALYGAFILALTATAVQAKPAKNAAVAADFAEVSEAATDTAIADPDFAVSTHIVEDAIGAAQSSVDTADDCFDYPNTEACQAMYGGIKQQYVVKSCQVTIYRDGPVRMVHEKTQQPCDAPLPKDHQFSKQSRSYEKDGCIITEYTAANGIGDATMDCSKRDLKLKKK